VLFPYRHWQQHNHEDFFCYEGFIVLSHRKHFMIMGCYDTTITGRMNAGGAREYSWKKRECGGQAESGGQAGTTTLPAVIGRSGQAGATALLAVTDQGGGAARGSVLAAAPLAAASSRRRPRGGAARGSVLAAAQLAAASSRRRPRGGVLAAASMRVKSLSRAT
jgi:hypothetical protein